MIGYIPYTTRGTATGLPPQTDPPVTTPGRHDRWAYMPVPLVRFIRFVRFGSGPEGPGRFRHVCKVGSVMWHAHHGVLQQSWTCCTSNGSAML